MKQKTFRSAGIPSIDIDTNWDLNGKFITISRLQEFINEAINKKATHFQLHSFCDGEEIQIEPVIYEEESDEEYQARLAYEENQKKLKIANEKSERKRIYELLKKEFENDTN